MIANYGYQDGSGAYFITIDTDKCNGCGLCVEACPHDLFELETDDYDDLVARVKEEFTTQLEIVCEASDCGYKCHEVCQQDAISHSW